jgi:hypothetical protein
MSKRDNITNLQQQQQQQQQEEIITSIIIPANLVVRMLLCWFILAAG